MADDLYCIDASSLIRLREDFPRRVFPTVWERVEELIRAGRLVAPDEVFREVENDDDKPARGLSVSLTEVRPARFLSALF